MEGLSPGFKPGSALGSISGMFLMFKGQRFPSLQTIPGLPCADTYFFLVPAPISLAMI